MTNRMQCPRMAESGIPGALGAAFQYLNKPDDGTCDYCGSLLPDEFMRRVEAGDVTLDPTDKSYKVYVHNDGGQQFKQSYRTDKGDVGMDQTKWEWVCRETQECKFCFQHLSAEQQQAFVRLLNEKKLKLNYPGHFYRLPFFIK
jgi:hypothetical protein